MADLATCTKFYCERIRRKVNMTDGIDPCCLNCAVPYDICKTIACESTSRNDDPEECFMWAEE